MLSRRLAPIMKRVEMLATTRPRFDFSSKQKNKKAQSKAKDDKSLNKKKASQDFFYEKMEEPVKEKRQGSRKQLRIPQYAAVMLFASCVPQSYWFYKLLWSELLSDAFFEYFQNSANWICLQTFIEGASLTSVAMIDYGVVKNDDKTKLGLRKKALTLAKYHPILIAWSFTMIDVPTHNCLLPLIIAMVHLLFKKGNLENHQLLPSRFYYARTFIIVYNLLLLLVMWYLGRTARKEKLNLELEFFHRIQRMLIKYDQEFEGYKFDDGI